ncbi:hypothetical protein Sango_2602200 [Sesamum angolense]|uniref:Uncharacterized protein n=1 Tax=Sesamum angolense TaxID=2727404 RepID=A0AAE1TCA2_9LAMI|nr:hypothetical protein Sango_2602200 [Sesamum angolense]
MLCSVSAGKSGSRWLDRLRNAKGFSDDAPADLENFLQNIDSSNQERSDPSPTSNPELDPIGNDDNQLFTIMSDVLNELFNFGGNCTSAAKLKKSARKQANPRICAFSNNASDENNNAASEKAMVSRNGDSNSGVEGVKRLAIRENEGEEDGREGNLSGFSRTEVTVIDTSYEQWKFDKLLYRKKNVWKVRDKKGKSESAGSKRKRKVDMAVREEQSEGKKQKIDEKKGCGEESELQLNEVYQHSDKPEAHDKVPDKLGKVLKKKQVELNLENGSSSVILIKSIPICKKNGTSISRSCLKSKQNKP